MVVLETLVPFEAGVVLFELVPLVWLLTSGPTGTMGPVITALPGVGIDETGTMLHSCTSGLVKSL